MVFLGLSRGRGKSHRRKAVSDGVKGKAGVFVPGLLLSGPQ